MARKADPHKRTELALSALEVLRQRGVHQVTMSEIAQALGIKRPTLYWYFKDLGQLFEAVLAATLERQRDFLAHRLAGHAHPVDLLAAYIEGLHAFFEDQRDFVILLLQLWATGQPDQPDRVLELTNAHFRPLRELACRSLEQGIAQGTVAPCRPEAVVDLVAALADGALLHHLANGAPLAPIRELLWESVLAPLKRPQSQGGPDDRHGP